MGLLNKNKKPVLKKNILINGVIFNELINRGYSVEGKTRVWEISDSKLWYLTDEQAQAFIDMETQDKLQDILVKKELDLIKENFEDIVQEFKGKCTNIIDLGCGDGEKAVSFISNFRNKKKIRYCPIDVSNFMIEKTLDNIYQKFSDKGLDVKWNISDFHNLENISSLLRKGMFSTNFFLLLGGTIENTDIHELLYNIRSSMKEGSSLLIGNKITNLKEDNISKMIAYYNKNKFIDNLFMETLFQLGLTRQDVEYSARFREKRVEMFYILKKDKTIEFQGKKVSFNKGDKIIIAYSHKYDKESLMACLNIYFNKVRIYVSKDGDYVLALCKK